MKAALMALMAFVATISSSVVLADGGPAKLLVIPFGFFDTSGEVRDQRAEHALRLSTMSRELGSELERKGLFRVVLQRADAKPCAPADTDCILKEARSAGADIILTGAVQKVSTMASSIWVGAFAATNGQRIFFRQLTFRGDTDDAWHHATSFLAHQFEADPPKLQ